VSPVPLHSAGVCQRSSLPPPQRSRLRAPFRDGCLARDQEIGRHSLTRGLTAATGRGRRESSLRDRPSIVPRWTIRRGGSPCLSFLPGLFFPCGSAGLAGGPRPAEVGAVAPNPMHDDGRACAPAPRWPGARHGGGRPPSPRPSARTISRPGSARPVRRRRRGREVPRQHPPLAAGLQQGEDRVHHPPQAGRPRAARRGAAPAAAARAAPTPGPSRRLHRSRPDAHSRAGCPPSMHPDPPLPLVRKRGEPDRRRSRNLRQELRAQARKRTRSSMNRRQARPRRLKASRARVPSGGWTPSIRDSKGSGALTPASARRRSPVHGGVAQLVRAAES
jgi:hypothetical protein